MLTCDLRQFLFSHSRQIIFNRLVLLEVLLKAIFFQIRFQAEDLLGNLLIFALNSFQFCLPLVEMQALCFEVYSGLRLTLAHSFGQRTGLCRLFTRGNFH